jgi:hypothetical protein
MAISPNQVTCDYAIMVGSMMYLTGRDLAFSPRSLHKMLRTTFKASIAVISTRSHQSARIFRPLVVSGTRYNSSRTPEQRKASNKAKNELQKDWVAPILTYEEVKQKSKQPSEVRIGFAVHLIDSQSRSRMRI